MRVSELYAPGGPFNGKPLHIVGTGPSMRVFPLDFLKGRLCILLNDACKYYTQLGPVAFSNNLRWLEGANANIKYKIVKGRYFDDDNPEREDNHVPWEHPGYYVFSYHEKKYDGVSHHDRSRLWIEPLFYWSTERGCCAQFAVQFAALAGASEIYLVGCDCCALNGDHYSDRNIAQKNFRRHDYDSYAEGLTILAHEIQERFGVPLFTLSPFMGLGREKSQYSTMLKWGVNKK